MCIYFRFVISRSTHMAMNVTFSTKIEYNQLLLCQTSALTHSRTGAFKKGLYST